MPPSKQTQIICEVGMNHDGSIGNALRLIDAAAECGADAVKFQCHIAEAETTPNAPNPPYFKSESRYRYFQRTAFTPEQWKELIAYCRTKKIEFLCSPFSEEAVELLEDIGVERYKIPSGEVTNLPLMERIARTRKPVLLSSGMSTWAELDRAVAVFRKTNNPLILLQCTSEYPCPYDRVGLNVMLEMSDRYRVPVGLSDHTLSNYASFAAVTLGAGVIEKHMTFSRRMFGSDAKHSLEPVEFRDLVQGIRAIDVILQSQVNKDDVDSLQEMKQVFQKSVVATVDIAAGTKITPTMVAVKKPGTGIPAARIQEVVGRTAGRFIQKDTLFLETDLAS